MNDKVRGTIAIVVGLFAIYQGFVLFEKKGNIPQTWMEFGLGTLAIALGIWRVQRNAKAAGLQK